MKSYNNGEPHQCADNLLKTFRGEVPYSRLKGLDARNIDRPDSLAKSAIQEDANWVLETYEPRIDASSVNATREGEH